MPNLARPQETREMRLFSKVIELVMTAGQHNVPVLDISLAEFIARRRQPGDTWRTWDELRYELRDVTGEVVSDGTIRRWARWYGIPEYTRADGKAEGSAEVTAAAYAKAIRKAGIVL
jgi:hypothetical protein